MKVYLGYKRLNDQLLRSLRQIKLPVLSEADEKGLYYYVNVPDQSSFRSEHTEDGTNIYFHNECIIQFFKEMQDDPKSGQVFFFEEAFKKSRDQDLSVPLSQYYRTLLEKLDDLYLVARASNGQDTLVKVILTEILKLKNQSPVGYSTFLSTHPEYQELPRIRLIQAKLSSTSKFATLFQHHLGRNLLEPIEHPATAA